MKPMKLAILLSGGKDSVYAAYIASKSHDLAVAITIESKNKESYMYHTPNILLTKLQAESMDVEHIVKVTDGEKEKELAELREAILEAKEKHGVQGIVTGAVGSQYQASRVQRICAELDLHAFNPLWQIDQVALLHALLENNFEVIISGVAAYPFGEEWLGREIDEEMIKELQDMQTKYKINPAGEGGEIETTVLDCPLFAQKIKILKEKKEYKNYAGTYEIISGELVEK